MPKIYRTPDLHKPRYKKEIKKVMNREFYRKLRKEHPDLPFTVMEMREIIKTFHRICKDCVANTRDGLELPEQLGYIFVGSCKLKEQPVDNVVSQKYQIEIKNNNWDSNGWVCKVCYTNLANKYKFKNHHLWAFEPGRALKRQVSQIYRKNHKRYVVLDNFKRLNFIFRKDNKKLKLILKEQRKNKE